MHPRLIQNSLDETEFGEEEFDKVGDEGFENATQAVDSDCVGSALGEFVFDANGDGPFDWNQWDATDPPPPNEHSDDNAYGRMEFHAALDIRGEEKAIDDAKTAPSVAKPESAIGGVPSNECTGDLSFAEAVAPANVSARKRRKLGGNHFVEGQTVG